MIVEIPPSRDGRHLILDRVSLVYRRGSNHAELLALDGVTLEVDRGEFLAVIGPSGCGKTSLLLLVNGLLQPTSGRVVFSGRPVEGPSRDRVLVFQDFGLLPWRSVLRNVELGLELQRLPAGERRAIARHFIRRVGLSAYESYFPLQLSGGMRQRVGLARALAVDPQMLLMDEPFGALDAQTRQLMGVELLKIWENDRKTILFVTHDIDEAIFLADRIAIMSARPARVLDVLSIALPRPREFPMRNSPEFADYRRRIWQHLEREVCKSLNGELGDAAHPIE